MIVITKKQKSYDFTMVHKDTGSFTATPIVNGSPYILQPGDTINFRVASEPEGEPIISIDATEGNQIFIPVEESEKLEVGDYFCDITLHHDSVVDTFIKIPYQGATPISNFHVVVGV